MVARADGWELSLVKVGQTIPMQGSRSETTLDPHGVRLGILINEDASSAFRLEGVWMQPTSFHIQEIDSKSNQITASGDIKNVSLTLALRAESWFAAHYMCVSASLEERLNQVDYTLHDLGVPTPVYTTGRNKLSQTWARVGIGGRIWPFNALDWQRGANPSWYPILRIDWGVMVSPKGHGSSADLLPQEEFSLSWGMRF